MQLDQADWEPLLSGIADRVVERLSTAGKVTKSLSFGEIYSRYRELHVEARCSDQEKSNSYYWFQKHGPRWGSVQVHTIARRDVQAWVDELAVQSPSGAARAVNVMQAVINFGIKRELIPIALNPCKGVDRPPQVARDRFARPAELVKLNASLQCEKPLMRDFFWMCLHTAARKSNVMAMRWDEIDFDLKTLTIPHHKTKNRETLVIPLVEAAVAVLRRRQAVNAESAWVFPGRYSGHLMEPKRAWSRVLDRAGLTGLTIHDLRRTLASFMAMNGANQYTIGKMLGHKDVRSTFVYARLDVSAVRIEAEAVSEKIQELLALPITAKPEPLMIARHAHTTPEKQHKNADIKISRAEQIIVEGKILTVLRAGGSTKTHFYRKIGSQVQINSAEMSRVLCEMAEHGLIESFQEDSGNWKYALRKETH
jgi:integrase